MQKTELNLKSQSILTLEAGTHEAVIVDGKVFVLFAILSGMVGGEDKGGEPVKEEAQVSKREVKAEVVDDTKPPTKRTRGAKAAAPAPAAKEEKEEEVVEEKPKATRSRRPAEPTPPPVEEEDDLVAIPESEWKDLQKDDMVIAKLNMEGEDGEKEWEAQVIGFQTPKGSRDKKLFVKFLEDGAEDYLREGDQLFEYRIRG